MYFLFLDDCSFFFFAILPILFYRTDFLSFFLSFFTDTLGHTSRRDSEVAPACFFFWVLLGTFFYLSIDCKSTASLYICTQYGGFRVGWHSEQ